MKACVFALYRLLLLLCAVFFSLGSASALAPSLAFASVVYVDQNAPGPDHNGQTWDTAFLTIQDGVNGATPGGEVWVAEGTYVENVVMGEGVQLYGGFLGAEPGGYETSLDQRDWMSHTATIDGNQSGSCVVMAVDARADGFRITNGIGTPDSYGNRCGGGVYCADLGQTGVLANCTIASNWALWGGGVYCCRSSPAVISCVITKNACAEAYGSGGGMYCSDLSAPAIQSSALADNTASFIGGGMYCEYYSSPTVAGTSVSGNWGRSGGGIACVDHCSPLLTGNAVVGNSAWWGGGIWCHLGCSPVIANNVIMRNSAEAIDGCGGALYLRTECAATVTGNTVAGNSARWGGGVWAYYSSPTLSSNVIAANWAERGGGVCCQYYSSPVVSGNAFGGNAADWGGAIYCYDYCSPALTANTIGGHYAGRGRALACDSYRQECPSQVNIACCILWDGCDEVWDNDGSTIAIRYSDVWGGWPGEGNIDADPTFVDPDAGDYHVAFGSPCIDAGTNDAPGLPETDWDGEERIINGLVDIGADEYATYYAEAPDPQPECDGPLFGGSQSGFPAWVWFSIPLTPDCVVGSGCADPNTLLGFDCKGKLWYWDRWGKWTQVYRPPFVQWELAVGSSYLLRLTEPVTNPSYEGLSPFTPWTFEFKLGRQGWTWVGMPGLTELAGDDFMASVRVHYPSDDTGCYRTSQEDYDATPDNWITWGWPFYDTYLQAPKTFTPYAPFGNRTCYPWIGYRCWVKVGTAQSSDDPDQVTLIWPKGQ